MKPKLLLILALTVAALAQTPSSPAPEPRFTELAGEGQTDYESYNRVVRAWQKEREKNRALQERVRELEGRK